MKRTTSITEAIRNFKDALSETNKDVIRHCSDKTVERLDGGEKRKNIGMSKRKISVRSID